LRSRHNILWFGKNFKSWTISKLWFIAFCIKFPSCTDIIQLTLCEQTIVHFAREYNTLLTK